MLDVLFALNYVIKDDLSLLHFPIVSTAVHTIAHWYNYERFVAFNPPVSVTKYGLPNGSFVPDLSTVILPENAVSC